MGSGGQVQQLAVRAGLDAKRERAGCANKHPQRVNVGVAWVGYDVVLN
jgi:hypothetical protein